MINTEAFIPSLHYIRPNMVHGSNLSDTLQDRHLSWNRVLAFLSQILLLDLRPL